jgi:hypothetical protein
MLFLQTKEIGNISGCGRQRIAGNQILDSLLQTLALSDIEGRLESFFATWRSVRETFLVLFCDRTTPKLQDLVIAFSVSAA